jgi:hypothetical protein
MTFKTEDDIYKHLYDPNVKNKNQYSRKTLCVWISATIHSAISQGMRLGQEMERKRIEGLIRK